VRDALWLIGFAAMPLFGLLVWRLDVVRRMDLGGRIALAFAAGIVFSTTVMYAYALAGIIWTRVSLAVPLILLFVAGARQVARSRTDPTIRQPESRVPGIGIAAILAVTLYGIATARETCGDLIYFWGPKAQRFWITGKIDVSFIGFPHYSLMHSDYPPLLPEAFALASTVAHRFSWWGALFTMALFLAAAVLALRGFVGGRKGGWYALLLAAVLGYGYAIGMVAGAADSLLLLFELIALCALTFEGEGAHVIAAIAVAGAVMTKVEGAAFAAVLLIALVLLRRGIARTLATAAPAVLLLATWIAFCARYHLLDSYAKGGQKTDWRLTGIVAKNMVRMASYQAFYLPWLASLAPLSLGRSWRRAALPLLVAAGALAYIFFFYLHIDARVGDPAWWVKSSAERVLLTPLMALVVAAAAASE
jgi:hypothetical protein